MTDNSPSTAQKSGRGKNWLPYKEASAWAQQQGITSQSQWIERCKQGLPDGIPSTPDRTYSNFKENGGWGGFLGTGRVHKKEFVEYSEAAAWAQQQGITSLSQWRERCRQGLPDGIPSTPDRTYSNFKENGGWGGFLGTGRVHKKEFVEYSEAAEWAQQQGITSQSQWYARCRQGLPDGIPSTPDRTYSNFKENGGWGGFLNSKNLSGISKIERILRHVLEDCFGDTQDTRQPTVVDKTGFKWKVDVALPSAQLVVEYDGSHWHRQKEDLDLRKTTSLKEAGWQVVRVRGGNLSILCSQWNISVDEQAVPHLQIAAVLHHLQYLHDTKNLSLTNDVLQKLKSWTAKRLATTNFREILDKYDGFLSYEKARSWAQQQGITSQSQWIERCKKGLPGDIPSKPDRVYSEFKEKGGWGGFLGTGRVYKKEFVEYSEASAWAQQQGITSQSQWYARCRQVLPDGIPSTPDRTYSNFKENGGWYGFLGTRKKEFVKYNEASAWARQQGITSQSQWRERCKQGIPKGIPSDPYQVYSDFNEKGGWYGFLGKPLPTPSSENGLCVRKKM